MRIEVLRNLGRDLPDYFEGQVVDVEDEEGNQLVQLGLAEVIKAVPDSAAIKAIPEVKNARPFKRSKPWIDDNVG